jgi:DNA-binding response OmpR family regulator
LVIVALTADAFDEDRMRCMAVGMDDFMSKPVSMEALRVVLARWLPQEGLATAQPAHPAQPAGTTLAAVPAPDPHRVQALVDEVLPLLDRHAFKALGKIRELQSLVAGTGAQADIQAIGDLLQTFQFETAAALLRKLEVPVTEN